MSDNNKEVLLIGSVIRYTHKKCGFELDYYEGLGFSLFKSQCNAREHMRSGDWGEHWKKLMKKHPDGTATLKKCLLYCENCKKYFTEPQVNFYIPKEGYHHEYDESDGDMVPEYIIYEHYQLLEKEIITCPDCDNVTTVMKNQNRILCPVCGEMRRGRDVGNWD